MFPLHKHAFFIIQSYAIDGGELLLYASIQLTITVPVPTLTFNRNFTVFKERVNI